VNQYTGSTAAVNDLYFEDEYTGWIVQPAGAIRKSTDGGGSWDSKTSGVSVTLEAVVFHDLSHGWAAGERGTIIKTTNGGSSWTALTTGTTAEMVAVDFYGLSDGWAIGNFSQEAVTLRSTNGGTTWTQEAVTSHTLSDIYFRNTAEGWAVGPGGRILKYVP
jgi:photosystem II stability/assembly factor-like uncharacterized protein